MERTRTILCGLAISTTLVFMPPFTEASDNPRDYPPALVVANGALNVRYHMELTFAQVTYEVLDSYPASKTIQEVILGVERQGWKPIEHDPNGNKLHNAHRWSVREEAMDDSFALVDQRMGWYEDLKGNHLLVAFRYRNPVNSPRVSNQLLVILHCQLDPRGKNMKHE